MKYAWLIKGDFFRLWSGTFLSLFSSVLFYYSLVWWSLYETGSALQGGVMIGLGLAVSVAISPFTGWLSDRLHRGKLIAVSDMFISAVFFTIGILALNGTSPLLLLLAARVVISTCLTAIEPAARSLIPDTLRQDQIEKGIAFQEVLSQMIQVLVPLLTGVLFSFLHFGWIWVICGSLSFMSIFLEWKIKDNRGNQPHIPFTNKQLFSGFSSIFQNKPLRYLLYGTSVQQLVFSGFPIYIVVWSSLFVKDQAWLGGAFQSLWAMGTLGAALCLSFIAKEEHAKAAVPALMVMFGLLLFPLGWIANIVIAAFLLILIGMISGVVNIYLEGYLQRLTEGEKRGRSLGAFFALNSTFMPLGYALAGILSDAVSPTYLFLVVALPAPFAAFSMMRSFSLWEKQTGNDASSEKKVSM
ncbi:MFS transporter [Bacillus sp. z60-18]|uniref:MFS transporter n=1 Tax=unclassified Bacillus (in: firmicutes) TaxID=185979 RepID=UPI00390C64E2